MTDPVLKAGWKTTEFWLANAAMLLGACYTVELVPSDGPWAKIAGMACVVLGSLGYSVSRGLAKWVPIILTACLFSGCARFVTVQSDASYVAGQKTRETTTKASASTLWASKSALSKWQASQSDKTQRASVGSLEQSSEVINTNMASVAEAIVRGIVEGTAKAVK